MICSSDIGDWRQARTDVTPASYINFAASFGFFASPKSLKLLYQELIEVYQLSSFFKLLVSVDLDALKYDGFLLINFSPISSGS